MVANDEFYMRRALQLAERGIESAFPNPVVGAVIVYDGKIIGEGYHRCCGEGHAEVNAVASVEDKELLKESTIYVTLEPCSHYGKTPPCAKLIIDNRLKRVVVGTLDPFEKVSGRGVKMIRDAGIEVEIGVLEKECREINRKFFTAHINRRPYILLKWAESKDKFIAAEGNRQVMISTPETQMLVHKERAEYGAILVGAGTAKSDNPSLSVRKWSGRSPVRVVVTPDNSIPAESALLNDGGKTLVFTRNMPEKCIHENVEYIQLDNDESVVNQILRELYNRNIINLMVEGGAQTLSHFIKAGLWDEARIECNESLLIGDGVKAPELESGVLRSLEKHCENIIYRYFKS